MQETQSEAKEDRQVLPGISRNVFVLSLVSFFNDVSSEMLYPLVPIFLTAVLGAPVAAVGLIEGIAEATASLTKGLSGWLSDRWQKRRFLVILGKGVRTSARDALLAESTTPEHRGRAFGFHRAVDTAGAAVGPLTALALLGFLGEGDLRLVFVLAFVPALIGVLLLFKVRERAPTVQPEKVSLNLRLNLFDRRFKLFLLVILVFSLGNSSDVFLILRAKDLGFTTSLAVLAYVLYNVIYSLVSTPAGMLSDRIGRKGVMISGFLIFALVYGGFAVAGEPMLVWGLFAVYGLYMAMTEGISKALTVDLAPVNVRGTALGAYHTAVGLMTFPASFLAGLLWTYVSPAAPFALGGVTAIAAAGMLFFLHLPGPMERTLDATRLGSSGPTLS